MGINITAEIVGRILFAFFVIMIIVLLLVTFLPQLFGEEGCKNKQFESINGLINDAVSSRASKTIKNFEVQSCVVYIDFSSEGCANPASKCYRILFVGTSKEIEKTIPGGPDTIEISSTGSLDKFIERKKLDSFHIPNGTYPVEIGPYSIKFLEPLT